MPADIASLDWWLTAESLSLNDGDAVVDWLDSSSAGKHYGQNSSTAQPVYKTGILNGRPIVRFTTDDRLVADPNARTLGTTNTMIVVCKPTTTSSSYIFSGTLSQGVPAFISGFSSKSFEYFNTSSERATFAASTTGFHILSLTRTDDTGNAVGYFDGASAFLPAVSATNDWNGASIQQVGAFGAINFYSGDIAQILHFNAILTPTELNNVHTYLSNLYGISITLI